MKFVLLITGAYLLGSVPFGLIIATLHGKDLRAIGSGNIGATNVARALGRKWAIFCFCLDVLKGLAPMLVAVKFISAAAVLAVGFAAVAGHIFPVYVKFRGGKGVATSFGVALGLWPYYTICSVVSFSIWVVVVLLWRYVSLASIAASVAFPVALIVLTGLLAEWNLANLWPLLIAAIAIPVLVIFRHRGNIKRLLAGTENKIGGRKAPVHDA